MNEKHTGRDICSHEIQPETFFLTPRRQDAENFLFNEIYQGDPFEKVSTVSLLIHFQRKKVLSVPLRLERSGREVFRHHLVNAAEY